MNTIPQSILEKIEAERQHQRDLKFGGDTAKFDQTNTPNDWVAYITAYAGRASEKVARNEREGCDFESNMIKVAALAIAALEARFYRSN